MNYNKYTYIFNINVFCKSCKLTVCMQLQGVRTADRITHNSDASHVYLITVCTKPISKSVRHQQMFYIHTSYRGYIQHSFCKPVSHMFQLLEDI